jgi:hypothetical protein
MCQPSIRNIRIVSTLQVCQPYKFDKVIIRILIFERVLLDKRTPIWNNVRIIVMLETRNVFGNDKG